MADALLSELFVCMDDRLSIRVGVERVPERDQLSAQCRRVVDLAVEHDPDRAVLVVNWLLAGLNIDDCQARGAEGYVRIVIRSRSVWTAMAHDTTHRLDRAHERRLAALQTQFTTD